jgi:ADP-ribose 1''-phosphate phosphatase
MVKEKKLPVGHAAQHSVHKIPLPTDNSTTMAQSAKPKSSTSEAIKTQTKKQKITRYIDSDDEDDEPTISKSTGPKTPETKPGKSKTNITKQQVSQKPSESDDEDEEGDSESEGDEDDQEESEDDQTNRKEPVKATSSTTKQQASSKKPVKKRALDSEDDEVVHMASRSKKTKSMASTKKITVHDSDSEDEVIELTNKSTKSKPNTTGKQPIKNLQKQPIKNLQKQPIKPTNSTPTKKKQIFTTSKAPAPESSPEEEDSSSSDEEHPKITLTERKGDLFAAPPNTLLIHACNCIGSWNAGIALAFQKTYPAAYAIYQSHCSSRTPNSLLSTCLLIQPQPGDRPNHWIGCLFTSRKFGRGKDSKDEILDSTDSALQDMLEQLEDGKKKPRGVWMCKINSGSFKVPWVQTKKLIEALSFKGGLHIEVVDKK